MRLTYRLGTEDDLPAVQRLWEAHTNWGSVTDAIWRRYVVEPPFGGVTMVIANDAAGDVVGSFAFLPQLVSVAGREVRSCRPLAATIADAARGRLVLNPLHHPVIAMYLHGADAMRARGDALIYLVPDPRWGRVLRVLPWFRTGSFPLYRLPLPLATPLALGDGCTAAAVDPADPRVDALWDATRAQYGCAVVRDRRTLPWKIWSGEYDVVGVERGGELVGLSASRAKGDRQWLVCDVLAVDTGPALRATLAATAMLAHARAAEAPEAEIRKVVVLVAPAMLAAVESLGFVRDAYDFPLAVHALDPSLPVEQVAPAHWYVSAND